MDSGANRSCDPVVHSRCGHPAGRGTSSAAGHSDIEMLAAAANADAAALQRVLRHLVSKGIFEEPSAGVFALNEAARGLLEGGLRLGLDLEGIGGRMAQPGERCSPPCGPAVPPMRGIRAASGRISTGARKSPPVSTN